MKTLLKASLVLLALAAIGAAAYRPALEYWKRRNRPEWRLAQVVRGELVSVINATGQVKPVVTVEIGTFVSGPIVELNVGFNEEVQAQQILARIDPRIYDASVKRDKAVLGARVGEVKRVEALLKQAVNDEDRAKLLQADNEQFISQAEMDQLRYKRESLDAELEIARAAIDQAQANLDNSLANLDYTLIRAPVAGIIIECKIEPGQTLAAQFQTPVLFTLAPDMRQKMHVHALVDEADIGLIREAMSQNKPTYFTVDAYQDDLFQGRIEEVRFSATTTQNVVTYPVVIGAPNPDLKLLPGMTAEISFVVDKREDVLKIPNAALRFFPSPEQVRPTDRKLLEGAMNEDESAGESDAMLSAMDKSAARQRRNRRHVWVVDGDLLKAEEIVTGLSDYRYTEMVEGHLQDHQKLVTGLQPKKMF